MLQYAPKHLFAPRLLPTCLQLYFFSTNVYKPLATRLCIQSYTFARLFPPRLLPTRLQSCLFTDTSTLLSLHAFVFYPTRPHAFLQHAYLSYATLSHAFFFFNTPPSILLHNENTSSLHAFVFLISNNSTRLCITRWTMPKALLVLEKSKEEQVSQSIFHLKHVRSKCDADHNHFKMS